MDHETVADEERKKNQQAYLASLPPVGKSKIIDPNGKVVFTGKLYNFTDYRFRTGLWLVMGIACLVVGLAKGDQIILILYGIFCVAFGLYIFVRGRQAAQGKG